jgi:hypothetical protein
MKLLAPALWLEQARADRTAATTKGLKACHSRYLFQQAYEKSIKAFGIAILTKKQLNDRQFTSVLGDYFLHHHTPMTVLAASDDADITDALKRGYANTWSHLLKQLQTFRHELKRQLLDGVDDRMKRVWEKIDAKRPSKDPSIVSYRYPFFDPSKNKDPVAPASWWGWDAYQGTESLVHEAVNLLIQRAAYAVGRWSA